MIDTDVVGWVCEVLRITRLAPDIIRAILDGRQPRHLNLHAMRGRQEEVSLDWGSSGCCWGLRLRVGDRQFRLAEDHGALLIFVSTLSQPGLRPIAIPR